MGCHQGRPHTGVQSEENPQQDADAHVFDKGDKSQREWHTLRGQQEADERSCYQTADRAEQTDQG